MANTDTSIVSKTDKTNKSETSTGCDGSSLSTSVDGSDSNMATFGKDTFKETPKKGLNKAEEAEYANIMDELPKLEHLVKGLDVMISQVATDYEKMQSLMAEREETQSQIDALTERWMELEERL